MYNFTKQNDDTKTLLHVELTKAAESIGGLNFLLILLESMKEKKPNPLMFKGCKIDSKEAVITWNKIVFKDKLDVLEDVIRTHKDAESYDINVLEADSDKKKKKILNMAKALAPIEFNVKPINKENGSGFSFKIFDSVENGEAKLSPLFVAMFFCSTEYIKKAIKYSA
ncbi:hypothetical protein N9A28_07820 [Sulfurimonas sp.]|nr:hypothetical protein [Sulfurimonas sp.]